MNNEDEVHVAAANEKKTTTEQYAVNVNNLSNNSDDPTSGCSASNRPMKTAEVANHSDSGNQFSNGVASRLKTDNNANSWSGTKDKNLANISRPSLYRSVYSCSSSEDDDECCVYTYKGAKVDSDVAESLPPCLNGQNGRGRISPCSSPEMDFLEMDFDPGPFNGQDSDGDTSSLHRMSPPAQRLDEVQPASESGTSNAPEEEKLIFETCDENGSCSLNKIVTDVDDVTATNLVQELSDREACCSKSLSSDLYNKTDGIDYAMEPCYILSQTYSNPSSCEETSCGGSDGIDCSNAADSGDSMSVPDVCVRKLSEDSDREDVTFILDGFDNGFVRNNQSANLPEESLNISIMNDTIDEHVSVSDDDLLLLDPSYSISAVLKAAKILNIERDSNDRETLHHLLRNKQIPDHIPLVEYLFMRAVQNVNEIDLANFASTVFENKLHVRFFRTHLKSQYNLIEWLYSWMRKGAVPVVMRNIQERGMLTTRNIIRNPWRHNVVYKLESPYIHLSNPPEKVPEYLLLSQLSQPSLIYVKRKCILQKWHSKVDLRPLMRASHNRWYNENVLGQVATVIRENLNQNKSSQYVRIPSNCRCGISLFVPSENEALCREVDEAQELPTTTFAESLF